MPVDDFHLLIDDASLGREKLARHAKAVSLSLIFHFILIVLLTFGPALLISDTERDKLIQPALTQLLTTPPPVLLPEEKRKPQLVTPQLPAPPPPAQENSHAPPEPFRSPPLKSPIAQLKPDSSLPAESAVAGGPPPAASPKESEATTRQQAQQAENEGRGKTNFRDLMAKLQIPRSVLQDSPGDTVLKGSGDKQAMGGPLSRRYDKQLKDFSFDRPTILSDTRGVDFSAWLLIVYYRVRDNWYAVIPEVIRSGTQGKSVLIFDVDNLGHVKDLQVERSSGLQPYDRAAQSSIRMSEPFPSFPPNFTGDHITLRISYLYNLTP